MALFRSTIQAILASNNIIFETIFREDIPASISLARMAAPIRGGSIMEQTAFILFYAILDTTTVSIA